MLASLRRGALSGLAAGAVTAAFGYLLAEPLMDRAVDLETTRAAARGDVAVETFTRGEQHFGFLLAAVVVGLAFGVLYAVTYRLLHGSDTVADPWGKALRLGGAAFFAVSLVPFLRYPSNPPGVGDPATIDTRSNLWLVTIVLGLVGAILAGLLARALTERGTAPAYRQLAVTGVLLATVALTFVLPGNTDPIEAPVTLVWEFRLLTLASLALLWGGLAVAYGLLGERALAQLRVGTDRIEA